MHKYMTDLGLSPSSRSHVSAAPKLGPKPWDYFRDLGNDGGADEYFS